MNRSDLSGFARAETRGGAEIERVAIHDLDARQGKSHGAPVQGWNDAAKETAAMGILRFRTILK